MWYEVATLSSSFSINCENICNDTTVTSVKKNNDGVYFIQDQEDEEVEGEKLSSFMTKEALANQYSMGWNSMMDFEPFVTVRFTGRTNTTLFFKRGEVQESPVPSGLYNCLFKNIDNNQMSFTQYTKIEKELVFSGVCALSVNVSGNESMIGVDYGTPFSEVPNLAGYWNEDYLVQDKSNKSVIYRSSDKVEDKIDCVVIPACKKYSTEESCRDVGVCCWSQNRCAFGTDCNESSDESSSELSNGQLSDEKEEKEGLSGGAIAGIVIGIVVVVSALIAVFVVLLMKRKNEGTKKNGIEMGTTHGETATEEMIVLRMKGKEERIRLKEEIGSGAYGRVWSGIGIDGSMYGVKVVESENCEAMKKAKEEAEMMERLDNKYIAKVYRCLETEKCLYTVMELFEMGSLDTVLQKNGLRPELRIPILLEIGLGMEYLHGQGIIHRDLKPGNVLVKTLDPSSSPMCKFVFLPFPFFPSFSHSHDIDKHHDTD